MEIFHPAYLDALKSLKTNYLKLPLYKRLWFKLWSYRLASILSAINLENPTLDQIDMLLSVAKKSWFFKSIFGLLDLFEETLSKYALHQATPVLKFELSKYLTLNELSTLSRSSKTYVRLFQPVLNVPKFLHHVTYAEYDAVEAMLKKDNTLLTQRGAVTDRSGRTFTNISGFEYALWALDKHMWTRMLQCLTTDGRGTKLPIREQYLGVKGTGIKYTLKNGQNISDEKHFDFEGTIIRQLKIFKPVRVAGGDGTIINYGLFFQTYELNKTLWITKVGNAQKLLPMHVVYEYMSCDRSAGRMHDPNRIPDFTKQPTALHPFNYSLSEYVVEDIRICNSYPRESKNYWFHPNLGINFAIGMNSDFNNPELMPIGKDYIPSSDYWKNWEGPNPVEMDLNDMKALYAVRLKDLNDLGSQLEHSPEDISGVVLHR